MSTYRTQFLSLYRQLLRQCEQLPGNNMHKKLQHINTVKQRFRSERTAAAAAQDHHHRSSISDNNNDDNNSNATDDDDARAAELMARAQQHLSYLRMISPRNSTAMYHERNAQARHAALEKEDGEMSFTGKRVFKVDPQTKRFVEVTGSENTRTSITRSSSSSSTEFGGGLQHPFFDNMAYIGDPLPQDDDGWELTDGRIIIDESVKTTR